jgi:hypothetical protein
MTNYVKWTADERALIVNTIASFMKANKKTLEDFHSPGWFHYYLSIGQQFLPEDRRRRIASPMMVPWLGRDLRAAFGMSPVSSSLSHDEVAELVRANLDAVIAALQTTHVVIEKTPVLRAPPRVRDLDQSCSTQSRQTSVLIVGTQPNQAGALSSAFGQKLDLRFWHSDQIPQGGTLPHVDYCVGMVNFMNHSTDARLREAFRSRYWRVAGSTSGLRNSLTAILDITALKRVSP